MSEASCFSLTLMNFWVKSGHCLRVAVNRSGPLAIWYTLLKSSAISLLVADHAVQQLGEQRVQAGDEVGASVSKDAVDEVERWLHVLKIGEDELEAHVAQFRFFDEKKIFEPIFGLVEGIELGADLLGKIGRVVDTQDEQADTSLLDGDEARARLGLQVFFDDGEVVGDQGGSDGVKFVLEVGAVD
ncbi:hypothetical protein BpHYR1_038118 [Brachionus plicatilis]|uniref:Uncharacterized protein n=1 Tax=Brachionus plicatilis TaxID=10195 RepID=A0A3M7QHA6_BRAPC|nr:hypothetical protein BpHYR1_038118 [Brachionus plicatilis]